MRRPDERNDERRTLSLRYPPILWAATSPKRKWSSEKLLPQARQSGCECANITSSPKHEIRIPKMTMPNQVQGQS